MLHEDILTADPDDENREILFAKSKELFDCCDFEGKGFVTRRDFQRLASELPISLECLDDVFDRLDDDGNGYLSFEEFTDGFTRCLQTGFGESDTPKEDTCNYQGNRMGSRYDKGSYDDSSNDDDFINRIISAVDMRDMYYVESVRTQWMLLRGKDPDLIAFMDDIFKKVGEEVAKNRATQQELEQALKSKSVAHEEELRHIFDEMEMQMAMERERFLRVEQEKEKRLRDQMLEEVTAKEQQLQDAISRKNELVGRLKELQQEDESVKNENESLLKKSDELEMTLHKYMDELEENRQQILVMRKQMQEEKQERAKTALKVNQAIAKERATLVEELDNLRHMNRKLKDERDELANYKSSVEFLDGVLQQLNQTNTALIEQQSNSQTESEAESESDQSGSSTDVSEGEGESEGEEKEARKQKKEKKAKVLTVEQLENLSVGELKKSIAAAEEQNPGFQLPKNLHDVAIDESSADVRRGSTGLEGYVYPSASGNISEDELIIIEEEDETEEETPTKLTYQQLNSDIFFYNSNEVDPVVENRFESELTDEASPNTNPEASAGKSDQELSVVALVEAEGEDAERSNVAEENWRESTSHHQTTPEEHDPMSSAAVVTSSDYRRMSSVTCDNTSAAIGSPDGSSSDRSTLNSRQSMLTIDEESRQVLANAMVHFVSRVPAPAKKYNGDKNLEESYSFPDSMNLDQSSDNYSENSSITSRTPSPGFAYEEELPFTPTSQFSGNNDSIDDAAKKSILISTLINGETIDQKSSKEEDLNVEISRKRDFNREIADEKSFSREERRSRIIGHLLCFSEQKEFEVGFVEEEEIIIEQTPDCLLSAPPAELFPPSQFNFDRAFEESGDDIPETNDRISSSNQNTAIVYNNGSDWLLYNNTDPNVQEQPITLAASENLSGKDYLAYTDDEMSNQDMGDMNSANLFSTLRRNSRNQSPSGSDPGLASSSTSNPNLVRALQDIQAGKGGNRGLVQAMAPYITLKDIMEYSENQENHDDDTGYQSGRNRGQNAADYSAFSQTIEEDEDDDDNAFVSHKNDKQDEKKRQRVNSIRASVDSDNRFFGKMTTEPAYGIVRTRVYKIVFVGDSGCGKTSFIHRVCTDEFKPRAQATIGVDYYTKNVYCDGFCYSLQLWDTAGQERFRALTKQYFRNCDGIFIFYDITNDRSFSGVRYWMNTIETDAEPGVVTMMIGNKMDLRTRYRNCTQSSEGAMLADEFGAEFMEISVKKDININECLAVFVSLLSKEASAKQRNMNMKNANSMSKNKCCSKTS